MKSILYTFNTYFVWFCTFTASNNESTTSRHPPPDPVPKYSKEDILSHFLPSCCCCFNWADVGGGRSIGLPVVGGRLHLVYGVVHKDSSSFLLQVLAFACLPLANNFALLLHTLIEYLTTMTTTRYSKILFAQFVYFISNRFLYKTLRGESQFRILLQIIEYSHPLPLY